MIEKQNEEEKRISIEENLKSLSTEKVLDYYGGLLIVAVMQEEDNKKEKAKENIEEAVIVKNYLITKCFPSTKLEELKAMYDKNSQNIEAEKLALHGFAQVAETEKDVVWAYNENTSKDEEIDEILKGKLEKLFATHTDWQELLEEATAGSRICYLGVEVMITKSESISDLVFAGDANKINIINKEIRETNKEQITDKAKTLTITDEERIELEGDFEEIDGIITIKNL
jgi:hypothetical protein